VDPTNIEDMKYCPSPKTLKSLCGFIGLIRYYHKFVQNYGKTTTPLIALLKKMLSLGIQSLNNISTP
jgi:hypothetical protein